MLATELISRLRNLVKLHGDLPVHMNIDMNVVLVRVYDKGGNFVGGMFNGEPTGPAFEIYLHAGVCEYEEDYHS